MNVGNWPQVLRSRPVADRARAGNGRGLFGTFLDRMVAAGRDPALPPSRELVEAYVAELKVRYPEPRRQYQAVCDFARALRLAYEGVEGGWRWVNRLAPLPKMPKTDRPRRASVATVPVSKWPEPDRRAWEASRQPMTDRRARVESLKLQAAGRIAPLEKPGIEEESEGEQPARAVAMAAENPSDRGAGLRLLSGRNTAAGPRAEPRR